MKEPGAIWRFLKDSLEEGKSQGKTIKRKHRDRIKKIFKRDKNE